MSIHIIVDGYNMIYQSFFFTSFDRRNLELCRENLINVLSVYKKIKAHNITVIFDGKGIPLMYPFRDRYRGINIIFSENNQTADQVINKIVIREKQRALVVSCDRELIDFAVSYGSSVIDSYSFGRKIIMAISPSKGKLKVNNNFQKRKIYYTEKRF